MKFCNYMEMWRKDMEEDDISNADCDGGWKYIDADLFRECDKN
jgi:hypothetical protein